MVDFLIVKVLFDTLLENKNYLTNKSYVVSMAFIMLLINFIFY